MSKRNLLLGTAAGKVGDLVFYRAGGEQRTRAKVTPNNPKTYAQQAQRSRLANVTLMYRALSALLKDSFPTRPSNQTAFNAFSADALPLAPYLRKDKADKGEFIPMPALVAKGSIPVPFSGISMGNEGLVVTIDITLDAAPTDTDELSDILKAWRPCCFEDGGKLIFAVLYKPQSSIDRYVARYVTIEIGGENTQTLASLNIAAVYTAPQGEAVGQLTLTLAIEGTDRAAAAVIMKPKSDGGYDVSDARMNLDTVADRAYNAALTDDAAIEAAISYGGVQGSCVVNG